MKTDGFFRFESVKTGDSRLFIIFVVMEKLYAP
jgi:hypothetical protein